MSVGSKLKGVKRTERAVQVVRFTEPRVRTQFF